MFEVKNFFRNIYLLPEQNGYNFDFIKSVVGSKQYFVCDFCLEDILQNARNGHKLNRVPGGYQINNCINVDHHAPTEEMAKEICSTNLAIEYVKANPDHNPDQCAIFIHHTDTDSVLASLILNKKLEPEDRFIQSALNADHYGTEDRIADLLEALKDKRDLHYSYDNLTKVINGSSLDYDANRLIEDRILERERATQLVQNGNFKNENGIFYAETTKNISLNLFLPLIPEAKILILSMPSKADPSKHEIKIRLGMSHPANLRLNNLQFSPENDFGWQGRWNAGSNRRSGGTSKSLDEVVNTISQLTQE